MLDLQQCAQVAEEIAREAGRLISATCGLVESVESKGSFADLVTETDKNVERLVFERLKGAFPGHRFIGEETVAASGHARVELADEPTWIVDPVDGTMNFVHTFPQVAVCIGLAVKREPVLGVVYCPARDEMYVGVAGRGSSCNGRPLAVRSSSSLRESLVCAELGSDRTDEKRECVFKNMQNVGWQSHGIRALGSAAMNICAVASGQANAYYEFGLHCWDMCAPCAVLKAAGGHYCDTTGAPLDLMRRRLIAACDERIARELSEALPVQLELASD